MSNIVKHNGKYINASQVLWMDISISSLKIKIHFPGKELGVDFNSEEEIKSFVEAIEFVCDSVSSCGSIIPLGKTG